MQISLTFKTIFAAGIALLIISCSDSKEKVKIQEVTLQDTVQEEKNIEPPPPTAAISTDLRKCFASDGLKYKTVFTLLFINKNGTDIVSGNVISEELGSGKTEKGVFEGTIDGDKYMIKFMGNPPTIGDASQWTDKPWTIEHLKGKGQWLEKLHITFNAKNYDTNKWENTDYLFTQVGCK